MFVEKTRQRLLAVAEEIQSGPSGDRQKVLAGELRTIAAEAVEEPVKAPTSAPEPKAKKPAPIAKARRQVGTGKGKGK